MFQVLDPAAIAAAQKPMIQKRESGPNRGRDADENAGPTTTVFVGNISEKASDMLVRQLLAVSLHEVHQSLVIINNDMVNFHGKDFSVLYHFRNVVLF